MTEQPKSLVSYIEAPKWKQNIALARTEFLKLANEHIESNENANIGKTKALKRFVKAFNKGLIGNDIRNRLHDKKGSKDKYYNWTEQYKIYGLSGLLPGYNNGGLKISEDIKEEIKRLVWENHLCRYQDIYEDLGVKFGSAGLPHYSTIRRHAKDYRADYWPSLVLMHEGKKGLRDRNMLPAIGRMDEKLTRPNERWEIDTTVADLFTKRKIKNVALISSDGKRLKIIGCIDVFSRMVRFYLVEKETALAVGTVIRDRILDWGKPDEIVIDNGTSYKNNRILHFLIALGILIHLCLPGNPPEKAFIEKIFRTLTEKLFRRMRGYSGNSVQNRPNEIEIEYTKEELQRLIDEWCDCVYAETVHSTTGQRPRERMQHPGFVAVKIPERELDILLMEEHERKVRQGRIKYAGGKYFNAKLPEAHKVKIRVNDFDASEVLVFLNNKYLCTAEDPRRKGWTPEQIREKKKERNRELKTRIQANEALINKSNPKDYRIRKMIDHYKNEKPVEFPQRAEIVSFQHLKDVSFSNPTIGQSKNGLPLKPDNPGTETKLIRSRKDRYVLLKTREREGLPLDEKDQAFLEEYIDSNEYRNIAPYLDQQIKAEAAI